jgi:E3 ubiquitin-protein ligase synoviolin
MIALPRYVFFSFIASACVVAHAAYTREQYFPAVMFLSTSKPAVVAFGNLAFSLLLVLGHAVRATFLGTLREAEVERLYDRTRDAVMETCLAMTIFREEFNARFVAMFVSLLFVKVFHWLYQDRVQYTETAPTLSRTTHVRLSAFMATLMLTDLTMLSYIVSSTLEKGPSVLLLFGFEYVILATKLFVGLIKYCIIVADRMMDGQWQGKGTCVFYLELVTDLLQLFVYFVFFLIIFAYYGMPVHLVRDLYMTFRNFRKRVNEFIRYRRVTANLNDRFPDSTAEDLEQGDDVCIICREIMEVRPGENMGGSKPKKLPCGHSFHLHCLRSWLERQQSCPTCRQSVLPERELRENAARAAEEEAQWQPLPPELQPGYVPPEVRAALDREGRDAAGGHEREPRADNAGVSRRAPTPHAGDRVPEHANVLRTPPRQAQGSDSAAAHQPSTSNTPTHRDDTPPRPPWVGVTPPPPFTPRHDGTGSPGAAYSQQPWNSPQAFATNVAVNAARAGAEHSRVAMDEELAHRVATAVASAIAAASAQSQLAFATIAPFGVPGLTEAATNIVSGVHNHTATAATPVMTPTRPDFSLIPRDASPAVRAAFEAEREATLTAMQAQVRLLEAQMATIRVQAGDEERDVAEHHVTGAAGKQVEDADESLSEAEPSTTTVPPPPESREDENDDSPAAVLRRRRLSFLSRASGSSSTSNQ